MELDVEGLLTPRTPTTLKGVDQVNIRPSLTETKSIYSQFKLLYGTKSPTTSILKIASKLEYPRITSHNCPLKTFVGLQKRKFTKLKS